MDADLVNRFIESAQGVLQTEIGGPVNMGKVSAQNTPYTTQRITTLIGVTGSIEGVMMFGLSEETAKLLVSRMIGQEIDNFDDLAQSGIAEMGNVIAGTAMTSLSAKGLTCNISPPTVIVGSGVTISTLNVARLVIPLITSCGLVEMQLALKANGRPRLQTVATASSLG
ncbi:MAG: chemotaxis protein CheX [Dehalococcoidales bacterium]|nr:chemotaxis protein CheX [Dehalococcoidales bacterium]